MKTACLFLFVFAMGVLVARADGEKFHRLKVGDVTYTNVTITSVSATDIYFLSAAGLANAKLKDLSPQLQKQFHYNARQAAAEEEKLAEGNARYHEQLLRHTVPKPPDMTREPDAERASKPAKKIWAKSFLNQKAPALIVEKWLTPKPDLRGKFVLIDFWATWCPPCRKAIPELNDFQKKFGDQLVVIGLSDESEAAVRRLTNPKIEYSVAIDPQGRTKKAVGVTGIPHVLIIDPQGIVRWEGFPFLKGYELSEKVVADILAKYSR